jgi:hypothetical protein
MLEAGSSRSGGKSLHLWYLVCAVQFMVLLPLCHCVIRPYWEVRHVVRLFCPTRCGTPGTVAMKMLGGQDRAAAKLRLYMKMPRWIAPDRPRAALLLGYCGAPGIPALVDALNDSDPFVREFAAFSLGLNRDEAKEALPALFTSLDDPCGSVRAAAVQALAVIAPAATRADPRIHAMVSDDDLFARSAAAQVLATEEVRGVGSQVRRERRDDPAGGSPALAGGTPTEPRKEE